MDARERAEKIAKAAKEAYNFSNNQMCDSDVCWEDAAEAAVRCAYEIDGVRELVEAAEMSVGADMALNVKANPFNDEVLAAAARVREAMGEGA